jgi:CspA family cold shock protein
MPQGKIKKLIVEKGFGFIEGDNRDEYFFHHSAVVEGRIEELSEGQTVEFSETRGPKGLRAENVKVI